MQRENWPKWSIITARACLELTFSVRLSESFLPPPYGLKMPKTLILFVHGLAGGKGSWGNFETLIKGDAELGSKVDVEFFVYPTGSFRLPWSSRYVDPQGVADGFTR
jgi:hypothetical protein